MTYIITSSKRKFYVNGATQWSDEYPDAALFLSVKAASKVAARLREAGHFVWVIAHYGLANETVVA